MFRRGPDHRRATDINILNTGREISAASDRRFKRVKVDRKKVDRLNSVFFHSRFMIHIAAYSKKAAVNNWL